MYRTTIVIGWMLLYILPAHGESELEAYKPVGIETVITVHKPLTLSKESIEELDETPVDPVEKYEQEALEETNNLEELLVLVKDVDIPVPQVQTPSALMVGIRSYGIAFVYACLDVKQWLKNIFA